MYFHILKYGLDIENTQYEIFILEITTLVQLPHRVKLDKKNQNI